MPLTTGLDTLNGTARGDVFYATDTTLTGLDSIDGKGGVDTLDVSDVAGAAAKFAGVTVSGVEKLVLRSTGGLQGDALDTTKFAGLTSESLSLNATAAQTVTAASTTSVSVNNTTDQDITVVGGGGSLSVTNGLGAVTVGGTAVANAYTSAAFKGGLTVDITDRSGASAAVGSTLKSVSLDSNSGAATITANGLATLTVANTAQNATVNAAAGTRELTVNLNKVTGGTFADGEATALKVNTTGAASSGVTLNAAKATSVAIAADEALSITDVDFRKATSVTVTGDSKVTIGATSHVEVLTSIDASASTGGVAIGQELGAGVTFKSSAAADSIIVGAATKAITMGAGDDSVTVNASGLGTGGSIDAGDGVDTLTMSAANAAAAATAFGAAISNFEKLVLTSPGSETINLANLDSLGYITTAGATALTLNSAAANSTLELTADSTAVSVNLADAAGSADVLNLKLTAGVALAAGSVSTQNVETVNINSDDTAAAPAGIQHVLNLVDAAAKSIVVTGDAGLALTHVGTALTSFDASGVAKGAVAFTTGALANAATLTGSAGGDILDASLATKAVVLNGGAGNDTLTVGGNNNTVNGGDGNDGITVGGGNNTVNGGDGNDTVALGNGNNTVDLGAGDDIVNLGTGVNSVNVGAGNDTVNVVATANGNIYSTISGMGAGDVLSFADLGTETFNAAKITLGGTAVFQDYLNAATTGAVDPSTGNGAISWFQFGGDTYVVEDRSLAATFANGADEVVKLAGSIDLSTAVLGDHLITFA